MRISENKIRSPTPEHPCHHTDAACCQVLNRPRWVRDTEKWWNLRIGFRMLAKANFTICLLLGMVDLESSCTAPQCSYAHWLSGGDNLVWWFEFFNIWHFEKGMGAGDRCGIWHHEFGSSHIVQRIIKVLCPCTDQLTSSNLRGKNASIRLDSPAQCMHVGRNWNDVVCVACSKPHPDRPRSCQLGSVLSRVSIERSRVSIERSRVSIASNALAWILSAWSRTL